jgi:hypothetical protein
MIGLAPHTNEGGHLSKNFIMEDKPIHVFDWITV